MDWTEALMNYFPEAAKLRLNEHDKANQWLEEIDVMLHKSPLKNRDELCEAIRWAGRTMNRQDTFNAPSVSEVAGWVKRHRLEIRAGDAPKHAENIPFHELPADIQKQILSIYKPFKDNYRDVGEHYRELAGGETLDPSDEYNDNGEWKPMGDEAYERDGRPRRLVKYKATSVRRAVDSGIDEQT